MMGEPKHTPGPWRTDAMIMAKSRPGDSAFECPDLWVVTSGDKIITELKPCEWRPFPEADARLIAAAPDFFRVVKAFLKHRDEVANHPKLEVRLSMRTVDLTTMYAAVDKANGRASG